MGKRYIKLNDESSSLTRSTASSATYSSDNESEDFSPGDYTVAYQGKNPTPEIALLEKTSQELLKERRDQLTALQRQKQAAETRKAQLEAIVNAQPTSKAKHAGRVGIANMTTGFTIGGMLTFLYSTVEKFKAGPSPVPPPFNFIIFPVLGILGLVAAGLSIAQAVLDPTRANIANAVFNTGDGLITAGIIAASLALPAVIIPIIPYVFMGIMGVQLAKKLFEAGKAIYRHATTNDPREKAGLKEVIGIHLTGATSFGLGIASVGVVMLFAHFALAPIGIAAGVFLSGFMGVLLAKTLYNKHKQAKLVAQANKELQNDLTDEKTNAIKQAYKAKKTEIKQMVVEVQAELDAAHELESAQALAPVEMAQAPADEQIRALMLQNTVLRDENDALKESLNHVTREFNEATASLTQATQAVEAKTAGLEQLLKAREQEAKTTEPDVRLTDSNVALFARPSARKPTETTNLTRKRSQSFS